MKRPLCLLCLTFVVVLAICMQFVPMPVPDYDSLDGQWLTLQGQVYRKEHKERSGFGRVPVLYLQSVHILNGFHEESDQFWKSHFQQFPNYEIKNVICYMEAETSESVGNCELPAMGETVRVVGKVRSFSRATNPGEFDMGEYYCIMKLEFALEDTSVLATGGEANVLEERLYQLRQTFAQILEQIFSQKEASVMKAMLLGDKNGLDAETKELYRQSSIIHILSISGLHISTIGMGVYRLLRKVGVPIKIGAVLSMALIYGYGLMTGMSMSAVRAIFMFCLHLIADMVGRTYDMVTALALAAVLLLIEQPRYVQYSGFLFSFGAVAAIGVLLPTLYEADGRGGRKAEKESYTIIEKWILEIIQRIKQAVASGMAVTLLTLPVHLMCYYQFPIYSVVLNLVVIPLMTPIMGVGLLVMLTGGWLTVFAKGISYVNRLILWFYEVCCQMGSEMSGGVLVSGKPELWQMIAYTILLCIVVLADQVSGKKLPGFWKYQWIVAALCILLWRTEDGLQITILDVGQGDCIHIQSDEGNHYLVDGGSTSKSQVMKYQILPYLKSQGVSHLEAVFLTHSDSDHCSGLIELLDAYPSDGLTIGSLILPHIAENSIDEQYREIEQLAIERGIQVQYMSRGQKLKDGAMNIRCLHPYRNYETENANEYSLVLLVTYKEFAGLFTGDVEGEGEECMWEYMQKYRNEYRQEYGHKTEDDDADSRFTLLKVAHHGSRYSTSEEFLDAWNINLAIISCGKNNRYGHPHEETLERLEKVESKVLTTPECGAITIEIGEKVKVYGFKK